MSCFDIDISQLVPRSYAVYRPVVTDAFAFFLEHLSPKRREEILAGQAMLPPEASLPQRFAALVRSCPTLHKLGQVMARDRRLDPSLRLWLQTLESLPPGPVYDDVRERLASELAEFDTTELLVGDRALAEASVAVVVPFVFSPRARREVAQGVFKILKPGVEARLEEELAIWSKLGAYIDGRCADLGLPEIRYEDTLSSIGELLANEVHLDREQAHMGEAEGLYGGKDVVVPGLLPFCTSRVTCMERMHGTKVTETEGLDGHERIGLADRIVKALVARPLWTARDRSLFHADPHAGNLLRTNNGALAILDWSLVGRVDKRVREQIVQILLCALRLDGSAVARCIGNLAESGVRETALRNAVERAVRRLVAGRPPGFRWILTLLDDAAIEAGADFGRDLVFFRKSVLTLDGVLADIAAQDRLDPVMSKTGLFQILSEWPARSWAPLNSRSFGSHVSSLDLLSAYWTMPQASLRFWRSWLD